MAGIKIIDGSPSSIAKFIRKRKEQQERESRENQSGSSKGD